MRALVVGKAKTGTTALVSLVKAALEPCNLVMEPHSVLHFGSPSIDHQGNEAIKIVYEHYRGRRRHLDAIVHAEFGFPIDKVVFVVRDVRDEMVSKLLYHAKIVRDDKVVAEGGHERLRAWVDVLRAKEADPASLSFQDLCVRFEELTGQDLWARLTDMDVMSDLQRYISHDVDRDHHVLAYEDMVAGRVDGLSEYLGVPVSPDVANVDLGPFGHTRRSGTSGNWRSYFTPADVAVLRPLVSDHFDGPAYDDWELAADPRLDPELGSGYVSRIALG